uniref:Uncharacterized protein n=1 Tax=Candidatus Kentrum sp. DK TaxID=2126562 RepID=A0A450S5D0_9GAMM|nr:MAG: hypothetical protein BECKDK2373C_GA0170839_10171 [Candidatus Kentron sp. DK]VFJ60960.1 MAG: hypothetical protein BECKDK2373B_GA0170837_10971 [Candidatus Kentron sp. DK]
MGREEGKMGRKKGARARSPESTRVLKQKGLLPGQIAGTAGIFLSEPEGLQQGGETKIS